MSADEVLWTGHPSHWRYLGHWFWGLALVVAGVAYRILHPDGGASWGALLAGVVVGLLIIGSIYVDRARSTYTVTARKVIFESGIVAKSSDEVRTKDIRSIALKKRGLAGLFGVGDLEFSSAARDWADITFSGVAGATAIRDLVRKQQDATDEPA